MADRLQFKEKLAGVLALAEDQNGKITVDEVEKYFEDILCGRRGRTFAGTDESGL